MTQADYLIRFLLPIAGIAALVAGWFPLMVFGAYIKARRCCRSRGRFGMR